MLRVVFIIKTILCTSAIFAASAQPLAVEVRTNLPWYIEFVFERTSTLEPLSLQVETPAAKILFMSFENETMKTFRNLLPLSLKRNDVINSTLEYFDLTKCNSKSSFHERRSITFDYNVTNKASEILFLQNNDVAMAEPLQKFQSTTTTENPAIKILKAADFTICGTKNNNGNSDYHQELLRTALNHGSFSTRLLLHGRKAAMLAALRSNAVDVIRTFIVTRLQLPQLQHKILQAKFLDDGLLFEMMEPQDVVEILTQARLRLLQRDNLRIESTMRDFIEIADLQRIIN